MKNLYRSYFLVEERNESKEDHCHAARETCGIRSSCRFSKTASERRNPRVSINSAPRRRLSSAHNSDTIERTNRGVSIWCHGDRVMCAGVNETYARYIAISRQVLTGSVFLFTYAIILNAFTTYLITDWQFVIFLKVTQRINVSSDTELLQCKLISKICIKHKSR